jgi:hypothetical protein
MKITKSYLKELIKEELNKINEMDIPAEPDITGVFTGPKVTTVTNWHIKDNVLWGDSDDSIGFVSMRLSDYDKSEKGDHILYTSRIGNKRQFKVMKDSERK